MTIELTSEKEQRRSDLVRKLKQGEIGLDEAHELRDLLEREKHMISQLGNCLAILAITFLISYVDEYLESKSNTSFVKICCLNGIVIVYYMV